MTRLALLRMRAAIAVAFVLLAVACAFSHQRAHADTQPLDEGWEYYQGDLGGPVGAVARRRGERQRQMGAGDAAALLQRARLG